MNLNQLQKHLGNIKDTIPLLSKLIVTNLKENLEKNGANLLENVNGIVGITIKLFGQELIERYFENLREKRLENFGLGIYIKAAYIQANNSLNSIEETSLQEYSKIHITEILEQLIQDRQANINNSDLILHYNPKKHPAVVLIRTMCEDLLKELITSDQYTKSIKINAFVKHFNENIENEVKEQFEEDYDKHFNEIKSALLSDNEWKLLDAMVELGKIGFNTSENLSYQQAFASWKPVDDYRAGENINISTKQIKELESELLPVDELINRYFDKEEDHLDKLLFMIADFGKGKSVFLKHLASKLAKQFQQRKDGDIPIYFNLRDFDKYNQNSAFGVISDYLGKEYGINVTDESFKKNTYFFLIDSLDECGNLTEERINHVIQSVKKIQNIDFSLCRKNKIIITSRPIENNLYHHLNSNKPFVVYNSEERAVNHFLSLYGFKIEQFNNWIYNCLTNSRVPETSTLQGVNRKIVEAVKNNEQIDVYNELINKKILSYSELRRPIFAYMIYKLIVSDTELSSTNKIGVYLSFINVLTKEAKYMNDTNSLKSIDLLAEFRFRNILHSTVCLWMYEKFKNGHGFLEMGDISNTLEGSIIDNNDRRIIEKYREVNEVRFLSQSYFGQNGNTFYFQHQSFAEMLLAEYYLKIFISFALNEPNPEEARILLNLGNPTEQTIDFFLGLLNLLRDSASTTVNQSIIEKRKLLFPLLASMATTDFSKQLHTPYLKYMWFDKVKIERNTVNIPKSLIMDWPLTVEKIQNIVSLAVHILESQSKYLLTDINSKHTSVFNEEVAKISINTDQIPPDIDKWLALLIGNSLYTDKEAGIFFNRLIKDPHVFIKLMKNWGNFTGHAAPNWGKKLFTGIQFSVDMEQVSSFTEEMFLQDKNEILRGLDMRQMDFSHSTLYDIGFNGCILNLGDFTNCQLYKVDFTSTNLNSANFSNSLFKVSHLESCSVFQTNFNNIEFSKSRMSLNHIQQGIVMPAKLEYIINQSENGLVNYLNKVYFNRRVGWDDLEGEFSSLFSLLTAINKKNKIKIEEVKDLFIFEDADYQTDFIKKLEKSLS